ncbi:putative duf1772 family protein [Golovinomyces cichoracearum]|uniref:Putative duf1772 family protein n=1 Tax=Golovinomyces cichoracearum TaxID=62708 RepID=A0A420J0E3_9PEZI|nr:putative duf1772 family protein [Golovinomyces cichoracearum]
MQDLPISVRVAQAVGVFGTLYSAGSSVGIIQYVIPAIRKSPTPLLLSQWSDTYRRGALTIPPTTILTSSALAYVSYHFRSTSECKMWGLASAMAIAIVPFTFIVVFPTNKILEGWHKNDGQGIDRKEVDAKVIEWTYKHSARSCMSLAGGMLALLAMVR